MQGRRGGTVKVDNPFSVHRLDRKHREAQSARSWRTARMQVEAQAMGGTAQYAAFELSPGERGPVVRARIVDGAECACNVEEDDAAPIDEEQSALSRHEIVECPDRHLKRHIASI
jgi:hypothetical protein